MATTPDGARAEQFGAGAEQTAAPKADASDASSDGSSHHPCQSDVRKNRLKAPGKLTISDLELTPAKDAFGTFMGVPRDAVVASLKNKDNKIAVNFVLEGDINNPQFSLNEAFTTQLASSMAETLGVSLGGAAKGVGGLGQKGVEAAKGAVEQLFGGQKKEKKR